MLLAPLHVKSHYSLGSGTASPTELAERAANLGATALALTDIDTLAGQVEFHGACRARGVKAITGVEFRVTRRPRGVSSKEGRVVVIAQNRDGYENLCGIVTRRL